MVNKISLADECVEKWPNSCDHRHYSSANTKELCEKVDGDWVAFWNYLEIYEGADSEEKCNKASVPGHTLVISLSVIVTKLFSLENQPPWST